MFQQFYNRKKELDFLNQCYGKKESQFIVIYGRRRVGKTELMKQFMKEKNHLYFLCDDRKDIFNIQELKKSMAKFLDDSLLERADISDWHGLFLEFSKKLKKKTILAIDEFPYLIKANRSIPSIFQKIWDEILSKKDIMLILCGSSISMMEKDVLAYKSPLYGRRTGQWKVAPLKFKHLYFFFPSKSFGELIQIYAVSDGIPLYLNKFDAGKDIFGNIKDIIMSKGQFLYEEAEQLLRQEFREPGNYFMILKAIAFGYTKFGEIVSYTSLDKTLITKYLDNLLELHVIEKKYPLTTRKENSRDSRYYIEDNYYRFWFSFVYPNRYLVEEGKQDEIILTLHKRFNQYISFVFEDICRQMLWDLPFLFSKIGKWWHKEEEIDIVALNEDKKEILFCECKWQSRVNPTKVLEELKEKSKLVDWNKEARKEKFAIFAKSFSKKIKEKDVILYDLKDMEKALK